MAAAECPGCAGPAGDEPIAEAHWAGACRECRAVLADWGRPEPEALVGCPLAAATPSVDLGELHGLQMSLLAVEMWPEHTSLHIALGGPEGWFDAEPMCPRGRWVVVDAAGRAEGGLVASFGGSEQLSRGEVVLPPLSPDDGPWEVTVHRGGEARTVTIPAEAAVRPTVRRPAVVADPPPTDDLATRLTLSLTNRERTVLVVDQPITPLR